MSTCGYREEANAEDFHSVLPPLLYSGENVSVFASSVVDAASEHSHGRSDQSDVVRRGPKDEPEKVRDGSRMKTLETVNWECQGPKMYSFFLVVVQTFDNSLILLADRPDFILWAPLSL